MKFIYCILLILVIAPHIGVADPISVDEFKKITDSNERMKIIDQAPPQEKEKLINIERHLRLLTIYGGEKGLRIEKETQVAKERGLGSLEDVFNQQQSVWQTYIADIGIANQKAGMTHEEMAEIEKQLMAQKSAIEERVPIVHSLVLNMAASPQALQLEKKIEKLDDELKKRMTDDGVTPFDNSPITTKERVNIDKQLDQLFNKMKQLPTLPAKQVEKEYNGFSEKKMQTDFI